jgi:hypothetical protein
MLVQNVYGLHIMKENLFYWLSKKIKQFLIVISYEIESEGPVQEINYASETESGYLKYNQMATTFVLIKSAAFLIIYKK